MKENIIEIHLKNKEDYINTYNKNKLSYNLNNYILEEMKSFNTKQKVKLIICPDFIMSGEEKNKFVTMLKENFETDANEIINISKKENTSNLVALLIGLSILVIYYIDFKTLFLSELILIMGWGFLWQATYNLLFKGIETRLKITRRKQIIKSKIVFNEKED